MTLVDAADMLSVQQAQYHQQQLSRGNVIVSTDSSASASGSSKAQQKRKMYSQSTPSSSSCGAQPASVARRNARERNRVKQVNNGFATLRQHIPQSLAAALGGNTAGTQGGARAGSKKLSKVETLRMASQYIQNLVALIEEYDSEMSSQSSSASSNVGSPVQSSLGSPVEQYQHHHHHHHNNNQHQQQQEIKFEIKTESCDEGGYLQQGMPVHQHHHHHQLQQHQQQQQQHQMYQQQQQPLKQSSPVYVAEASNSPTPSFGSDSSAGGSQGYGGGYVNNTTTGYALHDGLEFYEPESPEDDDILMGFQDRCLTFDWQTAQ